MCIRDSYLPPYSTKYPKLPEIDNYYKRGTVKYPQIPPSGNITYNICYDNKKISDYQYARRKFILIILLMQLNPILKILKIRISQLQRIQD